MTRCLFEKALDVFKNADLAKKWLKKDASLIFDSDLITEAHIIDGWDERPISKVSQAIGDQ